MAEYIDREALIERLKFKRNNDDWNNSKYRGLECAIAQVKKAPAADVVEVVRCKDCVYYEPCEGGKDYCCWYESAVVKNDFCSYGERKTECTTKDITE